MLAGRHPAATTMPTRSKKKLTLHILSQNKSAIAAVETTIPRAANTRTMCVTNVKRKTTWLKNVAERRNLKSNTNVGTGQMVNKELILLQKAPIKTTSMPCIICPGIDEIVQSGPGTLLKEKHDRNHHWCFEDDIK